MTALVTMRGNVSDWDAFKGALDWYASMERPAGLHWSRTYRREGDEGYVLLIEEWDDHDSFHKSSDALGDEFVERSKADFSGWVTEVWTPSDAKTLPSDGVRSTVVWMTVAPPDWNAFKATIEWVLNRPRPEGAHSMQTYRLEGDPSKVLDLEEWDSHDVWMKFADKVGEEFNEKAKTEGLEWETFIWLPSDAKVID